MRSAGRIMLDELWKKADGDDDLFLEMFLAMPQEDQWAMEMSLYEPRRCKCRCAR